MKLVFSLVVNVQDLCRLARRSPDRMRHRKHYPLDHNSNSFKSYENPEAGFRNVFADFADLAAERFLSTQDFVVRNEHGTFPFRKTPHSKINLNWWRVK